MLKTEQIKALFGGRKGEDRVLLLKKFNQCESLEEAPEGHTMKNLKELV